MMLPDRYINDSNFGDSDGNNHNNHSNHNDNNNSNCKKNQQ